MPLPVPHIPRSERRFWEREEREAEIERKRWENHLRREKIFEAARERNRLNGKPQWVNPGPRGGRRTKRRHHKRRRTHRK
jgi:hypothetical protein